MGKRRSKNRHTRKFPHSSHSACSSNYYKRAGLEKKYIMFLCVVASSPELPTPTSPTTKTTKNEKFPHLLSHTQKSGKTHDDDNNNNNNNNNRNVLGKYFYIITDYEGKYIVTSCAVIKFSAHDFSPFPAGIFFPPTLPYKWRLGMGAFFPLETKNKGKGFTKMILTSWLSCSKSRTITKVCVNLWENWHACQLLNPVCRKMMLDLWTFHWLLSKMAVFSLKLYATSIAMQLSQWFRILCFFKF